MYIKRLKKWNEADWENYFKKFPKVDTDEKRIAVQKVLMENKEVIESYFYFLEQVEIINGIGPSGILFKPFRSIITILFKGVKFEWHDIEFGIGGTLEDYHRANYGLLKNSYETIANNFGKVMSLDIIIFFKICLILCMFIYSIISHMIATFCYIMVEFFGYFSFDFYERIN